MPAVNTPLVSVIIPCYNQAAFLEQAVSSVQRQDYCPVEIIVVNDGSTDETESVARRLKDVRYLAQPNGGLSAARNAGIRQAGGGYLVFLDADDVLLPGAIRYQVGVLEKMEEAAFVSGGHYKTDAALKVLEAAGEEVRDQHYLRLLQGNYIGMHAAVMYRRNVFDRFLFDTSLKAAEDYDLYLKIAAAYPVLHHCVPMAMYRLHHHSMSANLPLMLASVREVLGRQRPRLSTGEERMALKQGLGNWKRYYGEMMFRQLLEGRVKRKDDQEQFLKTLWKCRPRLYFRYYLFKSGLLSKPY